MLFGFPSPPGGKLPIQAHKRPTFPLCSGKVFGPARGGTLLRFALRKRCGGLSRFALGKSPGAGFRALLWRSPAGHTFALCSGEVHRAAGLSDFALAKSAVRVDFQTLLWKSPSGRWTFGLCSGEVRRRGGLSDFALAKSKPGGRLLRFALGKSTGSVVFRALLWRSAAGPHFPALLWRSHPPGPFPLCSGKVRRL